MIGIYSTVTYRTLTKNGARARAAATVLHGTELARAAVTRGVSSSTSHAMLLPCLGRGTEQRAPSHGARGGIALDQAGNVDPVSIGMRKRARTSSSVMCRVGPSGHDGSPSGAWYRTALSISGRPPHVTHALSAPFSSLIRRGQGRNKKWPADHSTRVADGRPSESVPLPPVF